MGRLTPILRHPFVVRVDRLQARLRILATTDLHMQVLAYDYFTDRPTVSGGLAKVASLIRAHRAVAENCLLVDNGDFLQGNPLSDQMASDPYGRPNPMIAAMNALAYDAGTLGNHEFNYGLAFLDRTLPQARFPVVSANITVGQARHPAQDRHYVPPYVILDRAIVDSDGGRHDIRIGVIGFAPPQITQWDKLGLAGRIGTRDIVAAALAHVPVLRAAGAQIVVALCHAGIGPDTHEPGMENAAVPLAAVPGIDVIVTGHTHQRFPGPAFGGLTSVDPVAGTLHGKPAVMAGSLGSHLGVIDLLLDHRDGRWQLIAHASRLDPVAIRDRNNRPRSRAVSDPTIVALTRQTHRALLRDIRRPLGETRLALHSYFSLLGPDAGLQIVADAQRAKAVTMLTGTPYATLPLISAVAPFRAGGRGGPGSFLDIPAGKLLKRHASELYQYPNGFCILALTGADVADWLERSVSMFRQIRPGIQDQPLIDPDFPAYNFDMLDGLRYFVDPSQPPRTDAQGRIINPGAARITNLTLDGSPLDPAQQVLVATNSYRAGGGGGYAAATAGCVVHHTDMPTSEIVCDYLRRFSPHTPGVNQTWRFRSLPDTASWFDTGPGAAAYESGIPGISDPVNRPDGFRRYKLCF